MTVPSLEKIDGLLEQRKGEIERERARGIKVAGYICCRVPPELIHAHGMIPIRLGRAVESQMTVGKEYIHQFTCPFIKCLVGEFLSEGTFYHDNVDVITGSVICLTVNRAMEVLKVYTGKPTLYVTIPHLPPGPPEYEFFTHEMEWFSDQLSRISGSKLDPRRLKESVELYNSIRSCLQELYSVQAEDNPPIQWKGVYRLIQAGFLLAPESFLELLRDVVSETRESKPPDGPETDGKPRILLSGSPVLPMDNLIIDTIEGAGARIVADTLCTGLRVFENLDVEKPTIDGLARAYLDSSPCGSCQDLDLEKDRRYQQMLRHVRDKSVDGVVLYCLRFCDPFSFKDDETKWVMAEKANVPVLPIHWEYGGSYGSLWTRIEGFVEAIHARRK